VTQLQLVSSTDTPSCEFYRQNFMLSTHLHAIIVQWDRVSFRQTHRDSCEFDINIGMLSSCCEFESLFDRQYIGMLLWFLSSCDSDRHIGILWVGKTHSRAIIILWVRVTVRQTTHRHATMIPVIVWVRVTVRQTTHRHATMIPLIVWVRQTHRHAITILWVGTTAWYHHVTRVSSNHSSTEDTSACYYDSCHLVTLICTSPVTSACYHHLVSSTDTSAC